MSPSLYPSPAFTVEPTEVCLLLQKHGSGSMLKFYGLNEYLLSSNYVPDIILGAWNKVM